jgi:hypothetical protein
MAKKYHNTLTIIKPCKNNAIFSLDFMFSIPF